MPHVETHNTIIIGSGQAGLAASYYLTKLQRQHVVLERGRVSESWRQRWDSFNLLTPNWMLQLPGCHYDGEDPDGFLTRDEMIDFMERYAQSFHAPVRTGVHVTAVDALPDGHGYRLETSQGQFEARNVIVCVGTYPTPRIPPLAQQFPPSITQLHTSEYRNPHSLPAGAILVVGSGVSGCQIADELNDSGRTVYLCTGRAGRLPRRYRGKDMLRWSWHMGQLERTVDTLASPQEKFRVTLGQFAGGRLINLHQFARDGMRLLGRLEAVDGTRLTLAPDLHRNLTEIDAGVERAKKEIDDFIAKHDIDAPPPDPADDPILRDGYDVKLLPEIDLEREGISTVLWATGYKYHYPWIHLPIGDEDGYPIHWRGVTNYPGLYFVGLRWLYKHKSSFVYGAGYDAAYVTAYLEAHENGAVTTQGQ